MDPNERFIHDELATRAKSGLPAIKEQWRTRQTIDPFFVSWPAEHIIADDGVEVTDHFVLDLPKDKTMWKELMLRAIRRTKSYAILLAEELEGSVLVTFESPHGTRSWRFPIRDHGNVRVLGKPVQKDDYDRIGILWSPRSHEA